MDRVHEAVKAHIINTGGSIFKCFKELGKDGSNFLTTEDLLDGLHALGATDLTAADARRVVRVLDTNGDGKVSYIEWAHLLSSWSGATRVDDTSHWAYYFFEDIRRKV